MNEARAGFCEIDDCAARIVCTIVSGGGSGHGLAGMRHRVEATGGRLSVESRPGAGTRIQAVLSKPAGNP